MRAFLDSVRPLSAVCRLTWRRLEPTVFVIVFGHALEPVHLSVITVVGGKPLATSVRLRVPLPTPRHVPTTLPVSGGNGTTRPSQFSSTVLPVISLAVGRVAGFA